MPRFSNRLLVAAALFVAAGPLAAQSTRALTHDDYDQWKSLRGTAYSLDGSWVAYQIEPQFGDGVLEIRQSTGDKIYRQPLGSGARFTSDGRFVVFTIGKSKIEERDKKIEELRKKAKEQNKPAAAEGEGGETPRSETSARGTGGAGSGPPALGGRGGGRRGGGGPGGGGPGGGGPGAGGGPGGGPGGDGEGAPRERGDLAVLDLATGKVEKIGKTKGFQAPTEVALLLYHVEKPEPKADEKKPDEKAEGKTGEVGAEPAKSGAEPAKPGELAAKAAGEPAQAEEPKSAEPATATRSERGGAGGEGRRGGRRGAGGGPVAGAGGGAPATPTDPLEKKRAEGTDLVVRDLATGNERKIADVVAYGLSRKSRWLWYHTSAKKPQPETNYGLFLELLGGGEPIQVLDGTVHVSGVTFDRSESVLAFTSDKEDFAADKPQSDLYLWEGTGTARRIAHAGAPGMPAGKRVAGGASFSRDGSVIEFSIQDPPAPEPLPILPEDKVVLDIWNWKDGMLQTAQSKRGNGERNPSLTAVWHRNQNRLVVLGDDQLRSLRFCGPDGLRMLGSDGKAYEKETTWDGRYADVWLVNSLDGSRTRILEKLRGNVTNSPGGRYLIWFGPDYHWWSYHVSTGARTDLTGQLPVAFHRSDDDHPEPDGAHGIAGWTEGDAAVLLYDEFDIWKVSMSTRDAVCVTDGYGRANRMRLRLQRLPREEDREYVEDDLLLAATQIDAMSEGFFADSLVRAQKPQRLLLADKNLGELTRPVRSERLFFTQSTFAQFPDLWTSAGDFSGQRQLTDANPQQKDYRWGKAELVHWIDGDGEDRKGILVKPDGFDPKKKYPMMVYFYERMSQGLHNYVAPTPGTSPNASYYVSNGYLWFMPDVVYEVGYPGASCVKCVVSGVQHLISQGFVDEKAIAASGHSWGGYQTAFLVTRTHIFAAVECGAAVCNMLSAYGGIRYESGVSRQFQYEQTQSRIGGTPWEFPLRYWENSPIYFADKVQTPVLLLHNDQDGAVPWTQGIEYFTALRRLGKEVYLFNYNGEGHGLRQRQNMKDWTRRMSEYFAHHLRGAPAPKWMTDGVPYHEREFEKLPMAQSYIDAHIKPPPPPKAPEIPAATPVAEPAAAAATPAEAKATPSEQKPTPAEAKAVPSEAKVAPAEVKGPAPSANGNGNDTKADPTSAARDARRGQRGEREAAAAAAVASKLKKGEPAPDFRAADETGAVRQLADYKGHMLLVWFYPKADTPGCTAQGCGLRDHFADFEQQGVAVLGISVDSTSDNAAFRQKHSLPFPLLCDVDRAVALAYGAVDDVSAAMARRIAVLIDAEGKVVQVWPRVDPRTFAETALAALPL
ncbi:MAG TPA: redoxin domain-containing protein [Planctomycetota bacterium]|nr:redoxin domain-containing protein [Planctomycetota bacterium]